MVGEIEKDSSVTSDSISTSSAENPMLSLLKNLRKIDGLANYTQDKVKALLSKHFSFNVEIDSAYFPAALEICLDEQRR